MAFLLFILFALLLFSAVTSSTRSGRGNFLQIVQASSILGALALFTYLFTIRSIETLEKDSLSVQLINELPQPIDFYIITTDKDSKNPTRTTDHLGQIRTSYYRLEHLKIKNSGEFWVVGFLGKNLVYFSQHLVSNTNMDQLITVRNYTVQNDSLAQLAAHDIENYAASSKSGAVWVTLDLLLLFLNIVLFLQKRKKSAV